MISDASMKDAVDAMGKRFDSHDVINWLLKHRKEEYLKELRRRNEGNVTRLRGDFIKPEDHAEFQKYGRGAKILNSLISKSVRKHGCRRIGETRSNDLWGKDEPNSDWEKRKSLQPLSR